MSFQICRAKGKENFASLFVGSSRFAGLAAIPTKKSSETIPNNAGNESDKPPECDFERKQIPITIIHKEVVRSVNTYTKGNSHQYYSGGSPSALRKKESNACRCKKENKRTYTPSQKSFKPAEPSADSVRTDDSDHSYDERKK
jgi:hypothetical protein